MDKETLLFGLMVVVVGLLFASPDLGCGWGWQFLQWMGWL